MTESRRIEVVNELLATMGLPTIPTSGAALSATTPNPIMEAAIGRKILPPQLDHRELCAEIRAVLESASRPLSEQAISDAIHRRAGMVSSGDKLGKRIGVVLRMTRGLAVRARTGWQAPGRILPAPAPAQPQQQQQQTEAQPGRLLRPDEPGYREQQSRIAQKGWRDRDYMAPPRKGEPVI